MHARTRHIKKNCFLSHILIESDLCDGAVGLHTFKMHAFAHLVSSRLACMQKLLLNAMAHWAQARIDSDKNVLKLITSRLLR